MPVASQVVPPARLTRTSPTEVLKRPKKSGGGLVTMVGDELRVLLLVLPTASLAKRLKYEQIKNDLLWYSFL